MEQKVNKTPGGKKKNRSENKKHVASCLFEGSDAPIQHLNTRLNVESPHVVVVHVVLSQKVALEHIAETTAEGQLAPVWEEIVVFIFVCQNKLVVDNMSDKIATTSTNNYAKPLC